MRAIAFWCGLATLGCLAGIAGSFIEGEPPLPDAVWEVPLVGIVPVVLLLVFRRSGESRLRALTTAITSVPPRVRWSAAPLVLAGAVLVAVTAAGMRSGTPEVTATGYQLYARLGSTPITRAEYLQEIARSRRLFAAIGFGLNVLAGACAVGAGSGECSADASGSQAEVP
ncbi:hypothetical protein ACIOD2_07245 [Amycolatopsis sp. NPDC088138]|uniref:hypothetical protein n=1 Tax=Amycolatopsis sp. NPDC088138 TaxID=3363938 RepID=UPI00382C889E